MNKLIYGFIGMIVSASLLFVLLAVFVSPTFLKDSINEEREIFAEYIGVENTVKAINSTEQTFSKLEDVILVSKDWLIVERDKTMDALDKSSKGAGEAAEWSRKKLADIHEVAWGMVYQTLQRIELILSFLPVLAVIALTGLYKGFNERQKKLSSIGYTSPLKYTYSFWGVWGLISLSILVILQPLNFSPVWILLWTIAIAYLVSSATRNFQKKY
jgi:hypothetical protein